MKNKSKACAAKSADILNFVLTNDVQSLIGYYARSSCVERF